MKSDTPLDYAAFQLSPKRSRCELFVSSGGNTEKLASGLVKPFVTHLKVAEEQVALSLQSIRLEVERHKNVESWFTKGTLERFVRFVSTPEIIELVSTYDAEMSQLEAARKIYSQGSSDQLSGGGKSSSATGADATKKELLRAIDVRLATVKQDLATSCARAEAAGFNQHTVADLQLFAQRFGANRLNQAASNYVSLYHTRPEFFNNPPSNSDDSPPTTADPPPKPKTNSLTTSATFPSKPTHADTSVSVKQQEEKQTEDSGGPPEIPPPVQTSSRRLSVQDRINLFENKQKEVSPITVTKPELRRLSSDVSHSHSAPSPPPPAVLRRWSGAAADVNSEVIGEKKEDQKVNNPTSSFSISNQLTKSQLTVSSSVNSEESVGSNQVNSTLEKTKSLTSLTSLTTKSDDVSIDFPVKPNSQINLSQKSDQLKFDSPKIEQEETEAELTEKNDSMTLRAPPKKTTQDSGSKIQEAFAASQQRRLEVGLLRSQKKDSTSIDDQTQTVESGPQSVPQKLKFQKQAQKDDHVQGYNSNNTPASGKFYPGRSVPPEDITEQFHRSRQLKGNQELNDELKIKANELEKLFAEHKLRGDQSNNPTRQNKQSESETDQVTRLSSSKKPVFADPVPEPQMTFESPVPKTDVQNHNNYSVEVGFADDSRGNLYGSYMKKRDLRLKELWDSNRAEKEARLKAMHDRFERHSNEMKAKLLWSADRQNSVSSAQRRAERLRSFSARSALKREEPLDFEQFQDDVDLSEFQDMKPSGFSVPRNIQGKKPLPIDKSISRTPTASIPRSANKMASGSRIRRTQPDNPLAQSVPTFSDLRRENTKPYSSSSKAAARSQLRNYPRSRSTNEDAPPVKEEKARRSQSLRKSVASIESSEPVEPKRFLRKNTGIGPGSGSVAAKMKASMVSGLMIINNEEETNVVKDDDDGDGDGDEEEEEMDDDVMETEDQDVVEDDSRMSHESETMINSESENGNTSRSFSQVDHTSVTELPSNVGPTYPVQESPGESPISWNSRTNYPFSDVDPDGSPTRSPASWNLHESDAARMRKKWGIAQKPSLVAAAGNTSGGGGVQSRMDMTKGFKRLLKFGRKSRNTESLADYISATTSEGDDDTEDGRDSHVNRTSSEDLRKSRMGYSQGSEASFNESDFYVNNSLQSSIPAPPANFRLREDHMSGSSLKGPRSFFSLSSFRSKGSESKPR